MAATDCNRDCVNDLGRAINTAEQIASMKAMLSAIEKNMKEERQERKEAREAFTVIIDRFERRVTALERARAYSTGWVLGAGAVAGAAVSFATRML